MKKIIILFATLLFAFNVEFIKIEKKFIIPNEDAILIKTKHILSFPFKFYKVKEGYILKDTDEVEEYLNNDFYAPEDAKFKHIKIAVIDLDKYQKQIINKLKKKYKGCNIKALIFLTPDEEKIVFKPVEIQLKYKVILNCKG